MILRFGSKGTGGCLDHTTLAVNAWAWLLFAQGMPVVGVSEN